MVKAASGASEDVQKCLRRAVLKDTVEDMGISVGIEAHVGAVEVGSQYLALSEVSGLAYT